MQRTLPQNLAGFISRLDYSSLPQSVVHLTKLTILDWLGSAIAGSATRPARLIRDLIEDQGGR